MTPHHSEAPEIAEPTYSMGAVARLTGLSPHVLRAWERRYGVVVPMRTPRGTRRYRAADLERLRLVKAAVDAGHRVGEVARLDREELEHRVAAAPAHPAGALQAALTALERLDAAEAERIASLQLAALGPLRFARDFAVPLLRAIGEGWSRGSLCVASEHLGSALLRSLLGSALRPTPASVQGPRILFATPAGERHEIGLLIAALVALGAGADPVYLGCDLPLGEMVRAAERAGASALATSVVAMPAADAERALLELRRALADGMEVWVGGAGARDLALPRGITRLESLDALEQRIALLALHTHRSS